MWVRIPLETYIFILNFSLPPRSEQVNGAVANEIKHVHSPEVIVVLDPRYDLSYKALYISTCSIALKNPPKCVWRWAPDRKLNFFNPPAHLCAVTYITEISLYVTLNNHSHSRNIIECDVKQPISLALCLINHKLFYINVHVFTSILIAGDLFSCSLRFLLRLRY